MSKNVTKSVRRIKKALEESLGKIYVTPLPDYPVFAVTIRRRDKTLKCARLLILEPGYVLTTFSEVTGEAMIMGITLNNLSDVRHVIAVCLLMTFKSLTVS